MENKGELAAGWRFLVSFTIVIGIVTGGFVLIYTWYFLIPLILVALAAILLVRWVLQR